MAVADRDRDAVPVRPGPGHVDDAYRDALIERFEFDPTKRVRAYSKGNRQKLILIAGLMTRADLLLLDEPTSGLDPLMELVFRECVQEARERGQTVFLSSHILSEVEALCDRVAILRAGRLVEVGTLARDAPPFGGVHRRRTRRPGAGPSAVPGRDAVSRSTARRSAAR